MSNKHVRSSNYQWLFAERSVPNELLESFSNIDNVFKRLNPFDYCEEVMDLEEQLRKEFWRVLEENLNEKQLKMIRLLASGKTQMETAAELSINQSSVVKQLAGSKDKANNKVYGGIINKMRKVIKNDEKINAILKRIAELREDEWQK